MNRVVLGDSLNLLNSLGAGSVDFCYIDPPFMTQKKRVGPGGSYSDSWPAGIPEFIGFLKERLTLLRGVLKDTGTVMVHVDPTTSHYVKVALDEVFGAAGFINEIVWCYQSGGAGKRTLAKKHDTILFYAVNPKNYQFNIVREPYPHKYPEGKGFHPDGRMLNDWWTIPFLSTSAGERCGYPTQKPVALLERVLDVATKPGDIVLDFFCGSGTTAVAAASKGRRFVVGDSNPEAVDHTLQRLEKAGVMVDVETTITRAVIDEAHLTRQREWSETTFGPGHRTKGVTDHIRKELAEIEADPLDLNEWVDVIILGFDGAWRTGASPQEILAAIVAKQTKNEGRVWPDWRTMSEDQAIEHDRSHD